MEIAISVSSVYGQGAAGSARPAMSRIAWSESRRKKRSPKASPTERPASESRARSCAFTRSTEVALEEREQARPVPLRRRLLVDGAGWEGEAVVGVGVDFYFGGCLG